MGGQVINLGPYFDLCKFVFQGMDFILRLSLAILKQFAPRLLTMDMETMIFVSHFLPTNILVDVAFICVKFRAHYSHHSFDIPI